MHHQFTPRQIAGWMSRVSIDPSPGGCWTWNGYHDPKGYGRIHQLRDGERLVHRIFYTIFVGPVPEGLFVLHRCDNPPCCRPDHLYAGTNDDNVRDRESRHRRPIVKRHNQAKLFPEQVDEIRRLALTGWTARLLAEKFGVRSHTIREVLRGDTWGKSA